MAEKCLLFECNEVDKILGFAFTEQFKELLNWNISNKETWYLSDVLNWMPNEQENYDKIQSYVQNQEDLPWLVRFSW